MNLESLFAGEAGEGTSRLAKLAQENPDKVMDVDVLDRPIALTQANRSDLPSMADETREKLDVDGWSKEVLDAIGSEAEAQIYMDADLICAEVNGKDALIRTDIDYDQRDEFGNTNLERMESGRAPLDEKGRPIELHHIGQKSDSPLAELTRDEHRSGGNDNVLHDKLKETEIDREDFGKERAEHWKMRAEQIKA